MADNIVDITFEDVTIVEVVSGSPFFASITGTLEVNYTTGMVTNCALTASGTGFLDKIFTSATLTPLPSGQFSIDSSTGINNFLSFTYTGFQPDNLFSLELALAGFTPIFDGPPFRDNILSSTPAPCFVEGALIRTPRGDVPVETLKVGDLVVTGSGALRPVKWLGHRKVNCRTHADPRVLFPIRIARDAFGPNQPSHDLSLSSGHSVCVDLLGEVLIPIGNLVNGATIAQIEVDEVSYWHVELESHDILIANNLPAESYLPMANRGFFEELRGLLPANLEGRGRTYADFCRPVVLDGPVLDFVGQRVIARAETIGWTRSFETDLHLMVDGEIRLPLCEGDAAFFLFPAGARDVRLKSNTFIPALVAGADPRSLGLSLVGLVFLSGRGEARSVSLDDERLKDGLHPEEAQGGVAWRWTKGELALSPDFWAGLPGPVALAVTHGSTVARQWVRQPKAEPEAQSRESKLKLHAGAVQDAPERRTGRRTGRPCEASEAAEQRLLHHPPFAHHQPTLLSPPRGESAPKLIGASG